MFYYLPFFNFEFGEMEGASNLNSKKIIIKSC